MNIVGRLKERILPIVLPFFIWRQGSSEHSAIMLGTPPSACPIRLRGVTGYDGRVNDVIYCHPSVRAEQSTAVVYFGGDVQDFPENMESHRDNKNYVKWNLENTAVLLHNFFPESHIVVVRPSRSTTPKLASFMGFLSTEGDHNRMEFKTFSCYDNFVPCNNCGAPDHTPTHYSLQHLERLLQGISQRIQSLPSSELEPLAQTSHSLKCTEEEEDEVQTQGTHVDEGVAELGELNEDSPSVENGPEDAKCEKREEENLPPFWWQENINLDKADLTLIGFSKGCVVLNQFIYEFHYIKTLTPDDDTMMRLVSRIKDMYWLDGGHAGGKNTWIMSRSLLETLTRLGIRIHIHVTPYQVHDERRPWIRKEEKAFADLLRRLGASVQRTLHFENQVANLYTHFEVINAFKQPNK